MIQAKRLARHGNVDWDTFLDFAIQSRIAPLLWGCVRDYPDLIPRRVGTMLEACYQNAAIRNTLYSVELGQVLDGLSCRGLPVIVLKGAALGDTLYQNKALRPISDIDLLLRKPDISAVLDHLGTDGYRRDVSEPRDGMALDYESELVVQKPGPIDLTVDLHWHLVDSPYYQRRMPLDWFWSTAEEARIGGTEALVLGLEANLLYLSAHHVLHHQGEGVRWLIDIAGLISENKDRIDWDLLLLKAQAFQLVTAIRVVLAQLTIEWELPGLTPHLLAAQSLPISREERRIVSWMIADNRPVVQRFWADLASLPDWRSRIPYAFANLFPNPAYMQERYGLSSSVLVPLAYPYRWVLGLWELASSRRAMEDDG
ncbi:MAG: nucleotidyltransferase family protein [Chloroflexota bacterium]|nr:nucleotidyltransferase family protein [Chloroflexota bacterium]